MTTASAHLPLTTGSTYRFRLTAQKDGSAWDLTSATVTLYLKDPSGTVTSHTATKQLPYSGGVVYYDNLTTDLSVSGDWQRIWEVDDAGIVQRSVPIAFSVIPAP